MKYIVTFVWALMLSQMVNFILNSLAGGGPYNFMSGIVLAVLIVVTVFILDFMMKDPNETAE